MKMHICTDIPVSLVLAQAAKYLRVGEDFLDEFDEIFQKCIEIGRPKYCFAEIPSSVSEGCTCIGSCRFDSRVLRVNLANCSRAFPGIVSCGRELYDYCMSCSDVLEKYWIDGISELMMRQASEAMRSEIRKITGRNICSVSPGSLADFPLVEQQKLFSLLGESPQIIGVELTPSCLMLPHKSVSAIYFESEERFENCMLCLREECIGRRAAFNKTAFTEKFGLQESDILQIPGR